MRPVLDLDPIERRADAVALIAATPTLVAALYRLARGERPIAPAARPRHGGQHPVDGQRRRGRGRCRPGSLERYLIATIDHGFNASTFTARVIASTGADVGSCVVGALGALSGPLHGGGPEPGPRPDRGDRHRRSHRRRRRRPASRRASASWASATPSTEGAIPARPCCARRPRSWAAIGSSWPSRSRTGSSSCWPSTSPTTSCASNVEFYAGVVMESCGLPPSLFTPMFAVQPRGRVGRPRPRAGRRARHPAPERPLRRPAGARAPCPPIAARPERSRPVGPRPGQSARRPGQSARRPRRPAHARSATAWASSAVGTSRSASMQWRHVVSLMPTMP